MTKAFEIVLRAPALKSIAESLEKIANPIYIAKGTTITEVKNHARPRGQRRKGDK